ncbi:MAG: hypothetical protein EPO07_00145 [Verrucomicrobia bacterium]|nr:MAG: hypothetical protein EPO07_00145 [Verrucomicrobiota bacterium]
MPTEPNLRPRIKLLTWLFIVGLVLSGATAIPLTSELDWLVHFTGAKQLVETRASTAAPAWAIWLVKVQSTLRETSIQHPILFYGTDWLAFGHFVIAIVFVGALRDPVRNRWLFDFGLIACVLVIPYALIFGAVREIPFWWRLIDCSFGVIGFVPLWFCRKWARELERLVSPAKVG